MIRYYGLYANAHRGKKRKTGEDPSHPPIIDDEVSFVPSKGWAEMIRKVFEVGAYGKNRPSISLVDPIIVIGYLLGIMCIFRLLSMPFICFCLGCYLYEFEWIKS
jgi:hypothetical protein